MKKKSVLKNNSGLSEMVSFAGSLIIGILFLVAIIEGALLFSSVIKINNVAEMVSKQIQMSGAVDTETMKFLNSSLENSRIKEYHATITIKNPNGDEQATVDENSATDKKVQLQTQYTVILDGKVKFAEMFGEIHGKAVGISEVYSK